MDDNPDAGLIEKMFNQTLHLICVDPIMTVSSTRFPGQPLLFCAKIVAVALLDLKATALVMELFSLQGAFRSISRLTGSHTRFRTPRLVRGRNDCKTNDCRQMQTIRWVRQTPGRFAGLGDDDVVEGPT
jgi:hypothetical protein